MFHAGVDYHKRYSFVSILDDSGEIVLERRIDHRRPEDFEDLFGQLPEPVAIVYESSWAWCWLYEILEKIENVVRIVLANPHKVRLIAEAQIKTDKIDARKLATLLRLDVVPCCHIPDRYTRERKEVLRQRAYWVKQRTGIRNRIHKLIGRQHGLQMPQVTDLFGKKGKAALNKAVLAEPDASLLRQDLQMLEQLDMVIKANEKKIRDESLADRAVDVLCSIPGVGLIIGSVMATETDGIERFRSPERYTAYAGLAASTYSSGGKTYNGRMLRHSNKWLKWAFIEAAWVAVGCSAYFGGMYRAHRSRGKKANTAITIVARRMCRIAYWLLKEDRLYDRRSFAPAALVKA